MKTLRPISELGVGENFYSGYGTNKHTYLGYDNKSHCHLENKTGDIFEESNNIKIITYVSTNPGLQKVYEKWLKLKPNYTDCVLAIMHKEHYYTFDSDASYVLPFVYVDVQYKLCPIQKFILKSKTGMHIQTVQCDTKYFEHAVIPKLAKQIRIGILQNLVPSKGL